MELSYVFCHGWGQTPRFWEGITRSLNRSCFIWDLGYYTDSPLMPLPSRTSPGPRIGIGHSIGLLKLLEAEEKGDIVWDALIGIQAFTSFLGYAPELVQERRPMVAGTLKAFREQPYKVLSLFYHDMGFVSAGLTVPDEHLMQTERLTADLCLLLTSPEGEQEIRSTPILFLGSVDDPIVSEELLRDNEKMFSHASLKMFPSAGHSLGAKESDAVAQEILSFSERTCGPLTQRKAAVRQG